MSTVAAIDCGTNSLRLLLADPRPDGGLTELIRRTEIVRLGQGVDASGVLEPDALDRTFAVLDDYAAVLAEAGVGPGRTRMVATAAAREAQNRDVFLDGVRTRVGVLPEVISGRREAELSFTGALSSPPVRDRLVGDPVLVIDIGGGSTELVLGESGGRLTAAVSLPMGSVRLTERFWPASPPTVDQRAAATVYVDGLLDDAGLDLAAVRSFVGVAGTVVTLAWLGGVAPADPQLLPGAMIPPSTLADLLDRLAARSADEIRAIPGMHPGRADVITAGALIAARIAARVPAPGLVVSVADILDGLVLELLRAGGASSRADAPPEHADEHRTE